MSCLASINEEIRSCAYYNQIALKKTDKTTQKRAILMNCFNLMATIYDIYYILYDLTKVN